MRFWFDEDLSPTLVQIANERGVEATCNRDRGLRERPLLARSPGRARSSGPAIGRALCARVHAARPRLHGAGHGRHLAGSDAHGPASGSTVVTHHDPSTRGLRSALGEEDATELAVRTVREISQRADSPGPRRKRPAALRRRR